MAKLEERSNIYLIGDIEIHNNRVANVQILPIYITNLNYKQYKILFNIDEEVNVNSIRKILMKHLIFRAKCYNVQRIPNFQSLKLLIAMQLNSIKTSNHDVKVDFHFHL